MHRPVFLTGMMGSGKSTIGCLLAQELGVPFIDLDLRIERLYGQTIEQLFKVSEEHFRRCERRALETLVNEPAFTVNLSIVATGGGIVVDPRNRAMMSSVGVVVFLDVPIDDLCQRLRNPSSSAVRPLVAGAQDGVRVRLASLWAARWTAYRSADHIIDGRGSPHDVVAGLQGELFPSGKPQAV